MVIKDVVYRAQQRKILKCVRTARAVVHFDETLLLMLVKKHPERTNFVCFLLLFFMWFLVFLLFVHFFYCVRGTRTQPLICVGCSVHCWVSCPINKGSFFEIAFSSSTHFCLALRRLVAFCLTLTN